MFSLQLNTRRVDVLEYVPRNFREVSQTPDSAFGLHLLLASSAVCQREDPHFVEKLADDWN